MDFRTLLLYYIVIINIFTFIVFTIDLVNYKLTGNGLDDRFFIFLTVIGGSLGANIYFLLFNSKFRKIYKYSHDKNSEAQDRYMFWKILITVMLIIHIVVLAFIYNIPQYLTRENIQSFWNVLPSKRIIVIAYFIILNVLTFITFGIDKHRAIQQSKSRISVRRLITLAFLGGSIGALLAMHVFNHKTKKQSFSVGIWLILFMQVIVIAFFFWSSIK